MNQFEAVQPAFDSSKEALAKIYKDVGYFDKYGGSLLMSLVLILTFIGIILYFRIMSRLASLRSNWNANKCSPEVLPFAGAVVWKPGQSFLEATAENFNGCLSTIQTEITGAFLEPVNYGMSALGSVSDNIKFDINAVRDKLSDMGNALQSALEKVLSQVMNLVVPVQLMFVRMKDVLAKTHAVLTTSLFSLLSGYLGLKSFLGAFINIIIVGLIAATAIILPLVIFVFTWPIAIPMIILYAAVAVPLAVIIGYVGHIVDLTSTTIPKVPGGGIVSACLDENTLLILGDGTEKAIKDIQVDDTLKYDGKVLATMKVSTTEMDMYRIGSVIVSGSHSILFKTSWIYVHEHPAAIRLSPEEYSSKYVYCLNTSSSVIHVGNPNKDELQLIFSDWNDLDEDERDYISLRFDLSREVINGENLHKQFDLGYPATTKIVMENGSSKHIADISPDELLFGGNRVIASVQLDGNDLEHSIENSMASTSASTEKNILYHLITKTGILHLAANEPMNSTIIPVMDFNWNIEHLLDGYEE